MRVKALLILVIGVGLPVYLFSQTNHIFESKAGTHVGQKPTDLIGYWGATPIPKPIISGTAPAAIVGALAKAGLLATATPTATATNTPTPTPTPTP